MNDDYVSHELPKGFSWRDTAIRTCPEVQEAKRMLDAYIESLAVQSPFINTVIVNELARRGRVYRETFIQACRERV